MATSAEQILEDAYGYAEDLKDEADGAVSRLEGVALSAILNTTVWPEWEDPGVGPSSTADLGPAPTMGTVPAFSWDAPVFNPEAYPLPQYSSDYFDDLQTTINNEIVKGDPKTTELLAKLFDLLNTENMSILTPEVKAAINSAIQQLVPKLWDDIQTGGTGISQSVQDAIFNAMYERDRQAVRDALVDAVDNVARRGFPLPTSMSQAARDAVLARYDDTKAQRSRDITVLIAERAQQNVQFATSALIQLAGLDQNHFRNMIDGFVALASLNVDRVTKLVQTGLDSEKLKVDYSLGYSRVFVDISNMLLNRSRVEIDKVVAEFEGQVKSYVAEADVAVANARIKQGDNELLIKKWEFSTREATERTKESINNRIERLKVSLAAAQSVAAFYERMTSAALDQFNAVVTQTTSD